jgi:hypothetical protein
VDSSGAGIQGVTLARTGGVTKTATSLSDGSWTFIELTGTVTITPSKAGWTFSPAQEVVGSAEEDIVFTGTRVYQLAAQVSGQGQITRNPDKAQYHQGESVTITATPAQGWEFSHWEGSIAGTDNPRTLVVTGDAHIKAVFTKIQRQLNITVVGQGQVVDTVGDPVTSEPYDHGSEVRLTAVPSAGWEFDCWEGDVTGSDLSITVIMDSDKNVTAKFIAIPYTITTSTDGNGMIVLTPLQASYTYGDVVQVEAVPDTGCELYLWSGDLSGNASPTTLTVTRDMSIGAQFASDDYLGLGLGARWEYEYEYAGDYPHTHSGWAVEEVVDRLNHNGLRMYKVRAYTELQASDPPSGFFRGRMADTHYEFGTWSDGPSMPSESWHGEPKVIVTKPVHAGDVGFTDMVAVRQESVAVNAGTYVAWVFHRVGIVGERHIETDVWFVPLVGAVKSHEVVTWTDPDTGENMTDVYTTELVDFIAGTI